MILWRVGLVLSLLVACGGKKRTVSQPDEGPLPGDRKKIELSCMRREFKKLDEKTSCLPSGYDEVSDKEINVEASGPPSPPSAGTPPITPSAADVVQAVTNAFILDDVCIEQGKRFTSIGKYIDKYEYGVIKLVEYIEEDIISSLRKVLKARVATNLPRVEASFVTELKKELRAKSKTSSTSSGTATCYRISIMDAFRNMPTKRFDTDRPEFYQCRGQQLVDSVIGCLHVGYEETSAKVATENVKEAIKVAAKLSLDATLLKGGLETELTSEAENTINQREEFVYRKKPTFYVHGTHSRLLESDALGPDTGKRCNLTTSNVKVVKPGSKSATLEDCTKTVDAKGRPGASPNAVNSYEDRGNRLHWKILKDSSDATSEFECSCQK